MKKCSKCNLEKTIKAFSMDRKGKEGRSAQCKECVRAKGRSWYLKNRQLTIDRSAKWQKDNPQKYKKTRTKSDRKRRAEYPEKTKARNATNNAIMAGTLLRPTHCESCFEECFVEGHHEDYSKPLDVEWLCKKCHLKERSKVCK